jgi:hypothetical protein
MMKTADLKKKKLQFSRETLRALSTNELTGVVGGFLTETATQYSNCTNTCTITGPSH